MSHDTIHKPLPLQQCVLMPHAMHPQQTPQLKKTHTCATTAGRCGLEAALRLLPLLSTSSAIDLDRHCVGVKIWIQVGLPCSNQHSTASANLHSMHHCSSHLKLVCVAGEWAPIPVAVCCLKKANTTSARVMRRRSLCSSTATPVIVGKAPPLLGHEQPSPQTTSTFCASS